MLLRILHLEDDDRDAALIEEILNREEIHCHYTRVETEETFRKALEERPIDLVLADLSLPTFDGQSALAILQQLRPTTPFIFVSGTIGEEAAIDSIRLGATDYVLKSRLARLPVAIRRAIDEARARAEHRRLEQQILCVQRLEGFGLIAAGITHDLKNLLHPIKFASCLVQEQYKDKKLLDLMHLIKDSADRGIEMINQVMGLFRVSEKPPQTLNVEQIITELRDLVTSAFPQIEINLDLAPNLPIVYGQPHELHQALLNLAMNARDAMKGKGRLLIGAEPVQLEESFFQPGEPASPGDFLHLTVRDSGPGIPPELLSRIFEPLFTTKPSGSGTGLGLVSVTTILHNYHGFARVENGTPPGTGACFDLYFPANREAPHPAQTPQTSPLLPNLPTGSGQQIGLVIEEAALRAAFRDVLESYGYEVHATGYGVAALSKFRERNQHLDLVLLDRELVGLDGLETARALHLRQSVPIILVTIDSTLELDDALRALGIEAILHRPFATAELLQTVADVLPKGEELAK